MINKIQKNELAGNLDDTNIKICVNKINEIIEIMNNYLLKDLQSSNFNEFLERISEENFWRI